MRKRVLNLWLRSFNNLSKRGGLIDIKESLETNYIPTGEEG